MKGSAFLSLILAALLTAGCSGEKKDQKTPDVVPAENTQRETKTTTTGEKRSWCPNRICNAGT